LTVGGCVSRRTSTAANSVSEGLPTTSTARSVGVYVPGWTRPGLQISVCQPRVTTTGFGTFATSWRRTVERFETQKT
jgi:hypothetical protein